MSEILFLGSVKIELPSADSNSSGVFYYANELPVSYVYFAINITILLAHVGIIALNAAMILAIRRSRKIEEPTGHCLIILSLTYIWLAINMMYLACYGLLNMQNRTECLIRFGFNHSAFMLVSWANLLLTIDRFLHIELPFQYDAKVKIRYIWIATLITMILLLLFCQSPILFGWSNEVHSGTQVCVYLEIIPRGYLQTFVLVTFINIPAIVLMYGRLVHIATVQRRKITRQSNQPKISSVKWRPIRIVVLVTAVFLLGWCPAAMYILQFTFGESWPPTAADGWNSIILSSLLMCPSITAVINPCFYTLHQEVKRKFKALCCCTKKNNSFTGSREFSSNAISVPESMKNNKRVDTIFHIQLDRSAVGSNNNLTSGTCTTSNTIVSGN